MQWFSMVGLPGELEKNPYGSAHLGIPDSASGKEPVCRCRRCRSDPWVRKIPWKRAWQPAPIFLPQKSHGQRNLMGYRPGDHKESDTTEAT